MHEDTDRCLRAVRARDRLLDGAFVAAVVTTGVYCRPSCPGVVRAKDENLRFLPGPAAARSEGFRACLRCDPDAAAPTGAAPARDATMA